MRKQSTLQLLVMPETKEKFKEAFLGSGLDSHGSFLRALLDFYLSEDNVKVVPEPFDNPELLEKINSLDAKLKSFEEHPTMVHLFNKNKGKTFKFVDNSGKSREVKVESKLDIFDICISLALAD